MANIKVKNYTPGSYPQNKDPAGTNVGAGTKLFTTKQLSAISNAVNNVANAINSLPSTATTWSALQTFTAGATFTGGASFTTTPVSFTIPVTFGGGGYQVDIGDNSNVGQLGFSNTAGGWTDLYGWTAGNGVTLSGAMAINDTLYLGVNGTTQGTQVFQSVTSGKSGSIWCDVNGTMNVSSTSGSFVSPAYWTNGVLGLSNAGWTESVQLSGANVTTSYSLQWPPAAASTGGIVFLTVGPSNNYNLQWTYMANPSQIWGNTAGTVLTTDQMWTSLWSTYISGAGAMSLNPNNGINWSLAATGAVTFSFTGTQNIPQGRCGTIFVWWNGVGVNTISFATSTNYPTLAFPNNVAPNPNANGNTIYGYYLGGQPASNTGQVYIWKIF